MQCLWKWPAPGRPALHNNTPESGLVWCVRAYCFHTVTQPLILCGAPDTRLRPVIRKSYRKQSVQFCKKSLVRLTAVCPSFSRNALMCVATKAPRLLVADELQAAGLGADLLLEPTGRSKTSAKTITTTRDAVAQRMSFVRPSKGAVLAYYMTTRYWDITKPVDRAALMSHWGEGAREREIPLRTPSPFKRSWQNRIAQGLDWRGGVVPSEAPRHQTTNRLANAIHLYSVDAGQTEKAGSIGTNSLPATSTETEERHTGNSRTYRHATQAV